jgi:hypothetical protein
MTLFTDKDLV